MADLQYISLEQWRTLVTVVDTGSYAQAAVELHKSQSAVTYAVQKIESLLGIKAFEILGRKAILTPTGQFLYRRAKGLLDESSAIERAAKRLSAGWEAEIRLAAEIIFPTWLLLGCLDEFGKESPHTRIELIESVLGGTTEALLTGQVDFAISAQVPPGFLGNHLMRLRFLPVASPQHPLHQLNRPLTIQDLTSQRHIVIRESGTKRSRKTTVDASRRWTVSNAATAIQVVRSGYGFTWFSEYSIREELQSGALKPLPLPDGGERFEDLYLVLADPDSAGPGLFRLTELIRNAVSSTCAQVLESKG
jgi:DNA-binding transcriptional LysR family regulator